MTPILFGKRVVVPVSEQYSGTTTEIDQQKGPVA